MSLIIFRADFGDDWEKVSLWTFPMNVDYVAGHARQQAKEPLEARLFKWPRKMIDTIIEAGAENGIGLGAAWTPMHRLPMYEDCPRVDLDLDVADEIFAKLGNLPALPAIVASPPASVRERRIPR